MRVLTYGYDSQLLRSQSFQSIQEISLGLITKMRSVGLGEPSSRPVIFIAHSLGGIVVKEAITCIANSPPFEATLMPKIKGVIFFGVPNRGMRISHLLPLVEHQPNEPLVQSLREGSFYLEHLDARFHGISSMRQIDLVSIYETQKSPTPKVSVYSSDDELCLGFTQLSSDGQWRKDGAFEILVQMDSAIQRGTRPENRHPIDKDHSNLVKFSENEDDLTAALYFFRSLHDSLTSHKYSGIDGQTKAKQSLPPNTTTQMSGPAANLLSHQQKKQTRK